MGCTWPRWGRCFAWEIAAHFFDKVYYWTYQTETEIWWYKEVYRVYWDQSTDIMAWRANGLVLKILTKQNKVKNGSKNESNKNITTEQFLVSITIVLSWDGESKEKCL